MPLGAELVRATVPAPRHSGADARGLYWSHLLEQIGEIFDRAIERGEIPANVDAALAVELLHSPLHFRLLVTQEPLDESFAARLAGMILRGVE